jgi:hypothetical protein
MKPIWDREERRGWDKEEGEGKKEGGTPVFSNTPSLNYLEIPIILNFYQSWRKLPVSKENF